MPVTGQDRRYLPLAALVAGGVVFAVGLGLALARLPEWRTRPFPDAGALRREFADIAARCGLQPVGAKARFEVVESSPRRGTNGVNNESPATSVGPDAVVAIRAQQQVLPATAGGAGRARTLTVWFDLAGRPWGLDWRPSGRLELALALQHSRLTPEGRPEVFAAALLAPGESLAKERQLSLLGVPISNYPITGSHPPEYLTAASLNLLVQASRNAGNLESSFFQGGGLDLLAAARDEAVRQVAPVVLAVVFLVLAIRRRVGWANGSSLAAVAFVALLPAAFRQPNVELAAAAALMLAAASLWLGLLWSAAETLWRTADPHFDPGLDLLRAGRISSSTGRGLLAGTCLGAVAAGLSLAVYAFAAHLPHSGFHAASVALPILDGLHGPLASGITAAAVIAALLAAGRRLSRSPWIAVAVALVAAIALAPVKLDPWPLQLLSNVLIAGVLVAAEAESCRGPEGKSKIDVAEVAAYGGTDHEPKTERGADQSERLRAFVRLRDIGDVSECRGNVGRGNTGNKAAHEKPSQRRRERHEDVINAQAKARNEDHGAAAEAVRPGAEKGRKNKLHCCPGKTEIASNAGSASEVAPFEIPDQIGKNGRDDSKSDHVKRHHDENKNECGAAYVLLVLWRGG